MRIIGKLYNGYGEYCGEGIELNEQGEILQIHASGQSESHLQNIDNKTGDVVDAAYVIPGLVDVHCHGGGGYGFPDNPGPQGIETAIRTHRSKGTTGLVASLVSLKDPIPAIKALVEWCKKSELVGIHLEGPYVCKHRAGAQNPAVIRPADLEELESWLKAGEGYILTMTLAPEQPGAIAAAKLLLQYGAKPSWGHTSASGVEARKALEAIYETESNTGSGEETVKVLQTVTHLFNAMPPVAHRDPGPVREFIQGAKQGKCAVEIVGDGVHVHPDLVADLVKYLGDRAMLITDAMAGAGMPDGEYELGGLPVVITDGVARLQDGGAIAGGTATLSQELKLLVGEGYLSLAEVVKSMVAAPVKALGLEGKPGISLEYRVGDKLNALLLDQNYNPLGVVYEGKLELGSW